MLDEGLGHDGLVVVRVDEVHVVGEPAHGEDDDDDDEHLDDLPLGQELPLLGEVVGRVLPDDALAPEHGADAPVAHAHGHDRYDVRQDEVDDVVAGRGKSFFGDILRSIGKKL